MLNVLEMLHNKGISTRRAGQSHGGEHHSSCPGCGDGGPRKPAQGLSDRFQTWPDRKPGGQYCCRQCGLHGDNIQFLRDFDGMGYKEACADLGIEVKNHNQPSRRLPLTPKAMPVSNPIPTHSPVAHDLPADAWRTKAGELVDACHLALLDNAPALSWLAARGLGLEAVNRYRLGYNLATLYKSRPAWGLPEEKEEGQRPKPLWIPAGLILPLFDAESGEVIQIRIRRTRQEMSTMLPNLKYYVLPGSSTATFVVNPAARAQVVVESGLDAMLVGSLQPKLLGACCTWNATAKPDQAATKIINQAATVLIALDADAAGDRGADWWLQAFSHSRRLRPTAKDPGDMIKAGIDLAAWLWDALPPAITLFHPLTGVKNQPVAVDQAREGVPNPHGLSNSGVGGVDLTPTAQGEKPAPDSLGPVPRLALLMQQYRVLIAKKVDDNGSFLKIKGLNHCPGPIADELSDLIWFQPTVGKLLDTLPVGLLSAREVMRGC